MLGAILGANPWGNPWGNSWAANGRAAWGLSEAARAVNPALERWPVHPCVLAPAAVAALASSTKVASHANAGNLPQLRGPSSAVRTALRAPRSGRGSLRGSQQAARAAAAHGRRATGRKMHGPAVLSELRQAISRGLEQGGSHTICSTCFHARGALRVAKYPIAADSCSGLMARG
jgi:hypothetical protein